MADGGDGVYTGTDEGWVQVSPDAVTSDSPDLARVGAATCPTARSTRSPWTARTGGSPTPRTTASTPPRPANPATSSRRPTAGSTGRHQREPAGRAGQLGRARPGLPEHALCRHRRRRLHVTTNGGQSGAPRHGDARRCRLAARLRPGARMLRGRHPRPRRLHDARAPRRVPALVVSKADAGVPVGPGSDDRLHDHGPQHRQRRRDRVSRSPTRCPRHTTFVSAGDGGTASRRQGPLERPDSPRRRQHRRSTSRSRSRPTCWTVRHSIVDDGLTVSSARGVGTTGSPHATPIAPPYAVSVDPGRQTGGAKVGQRRTYTVHVTNQGFQRRHLRATRDGCLAATLDASCTTPMTTSRPSPRAARPTCACRWTSPPARPTAEAERRRP